MRVPGDLCAAVERELASVAPSSLSRAAAQLTERYKAAEFRGALGSPEARAAYLAVRLPATYAANLHVFTEVRRTAPGLAPRTMLDLGAGAGVSAWAAAQVFPSLDKITLLEDDAALVEVGRRMASSAEHDVLRSSTWLRADLRTGLPVAPHDLVTISYAIGEFGADAAQKLIHRAWALATEALVIVEPGTPKAFARMAGLRNALIAAGAHLLAPCPHHEECPMAAAGDWCHFAQRVERTSLHRRLKQGTLGYEDEKFSYLVAAKHDLGHTAARIVRHPAKNPGHVQLTLCAPGGLQKQTVGRAQRERYKQARQSDWGDAWE